MGSFWSLDIGNLRFIWDLEFGDWDFIERVLTFFMVSFIKGSLSRRVDNSCKKK
jgi:hypothetical protein